MNKLIKPLLIVGILITISSNSKSQNSCGLNDTETICAIAEFVDALPTFLGECPLYELDTMFFSNEYFLITESLDFIEHVGYTYLEEDLFYYVDRDDLFNSVYIDNGIQEGDSLVLNQFRTDLYDCNGQHLICYKELIEGGVVSENYCIEAQSKDTLQINYDDINRLQIFTNEYGDKITCNTQLYDICNENCFCEEDEKQYNPLAKGLGDNALVYAINSDIENILIGGELMLLDNESDRDNIFTGYASNQYIDVTNIDIKSSEIRCIITSGDTTYIGGAFSVAENEDILNIAMIVDGNLYPLKNGIPSNVGNTIIYDIEVVGDDVYVAGFFRNHEDDPNKSHIMRWDGQEWHSLAGGVSSAVYALEMSPRGLYVGGAFGSINTNIDPINQNSIGLWNGTTWEALPDFNNTGPNGFITRDLEYRNDKVYMAGENTWLNGNPFTRHCLAYYKDGLYTPVGNQIGNTNDAIYDIEWHNNELYIGGDFINAGANEEADYFAKLVDGEWVGTGLFKEDVFALHSTGTNLYVGGSFQDLDENEENDAITRYGCEIAINTQTNIVITDHDLVNIFPNPTEGVVHFDNEIEKIIIYNSQGKEMLRAYNSNTISIERLISGTYILELIIGNNKQIEKIVKW